MEKNSKKRKQDDSNSSVVESSDNSNVNYKHVARKYCKLHSGCYLNTKNCYDLRAMIFKYKKKMLEPYT